MAIDLPKTKQDKTLNITGSRKPLGRALLAFVVGIGGEFALAMAAMPFAQGDTVPPLLVIVL